MSQCLLLIRLGEVLSRVAHRNGRLTKLHLSVVVRMCKHVEVTSYMHGFGLIP